MFSARPFFESDCWILTFVKMIQRVDSKMKKINKILVLLRIVRNILSTNSCTFNRYGEIAQCRKLIGNWFSFSIKRYFFSVCYVWFCYTIDLQRPYSLPHYTYMIKSTIVLTIGNLLSSSGHGQANVKTRTQASHIIFVCEADL